MQGEEFADRLSGWRRLEKYWTVRVGCRTTDIKTFSQNKTPGLLCEATWCGCNARWCSRKLPATPFLCGPWTKEKRWGNQTLDMSPSFRWPRSLEAPAGASNRGERTELMKGRKLIILQYLEAYCSVRGCTANLTASFVADGPRAGFPQCLYWPLSRYVSAVDQQGPAAVPSSDFYQQPQRPQNVFPHQRTGRGDKISDLHWGDAGIEFGQGNRLSWLRYLVVILSCYTQKLR